MKLTKIIEIEISNDIINTLVDNVAEIIDIFGIDYQQAFEIAFRPVRIKYEEITYFETELKILVKKRL